VLSSLDLLICKLFEEGSCHYICIVILIIGLDSLSIPIIQIVVEETSNPSPNEKACVNNIDTLDSCIGDRRSPLKKMYTFS